MVSLRVRFQLNIFKEVSFVKVRRSVGYLEGFYDSFPWGTFAFVLFLFSVALVFAGISYGQQKIEDRRVHLFQCPAVRYIVQDGDSLWCIEAYAVKNHFMPNTVNIQENLEDIRVRNQMSLGKTLHVGDKILIPVTNPAYPYPEKGGILECR
jgi:hypothetical protein